MNDYFNYESFQRELGNKKAKAITSIAMFHDLEEPNTFVEDISNCLDENGVWIVQMNYLGLMVENNTFDNISHPIARISTEAYRIVTCEEKGKRQCLNLSRQLLKPVNL
jgi:hypothetical protein